jgi:hypothetical protein
MGSQEGSWGRRPAVAAIAAAAALAGGAGGLAPASAEAQAGAPAADEPAPVMLRGYLLDRRKGRLTTIEPPGAITTKPGEINNRGEVIGGYSDGRAVHSFLRDRSGRYTTIDPPGAGGLVIGTGDINDRREIAASYADTAGTFRSFLRNRNGAFTPIEHPDASGSSPHGSGTAVSGINDRQEMVGAYAAGGTAHGFLRNRKGAFTTIDYPGAAETSLVEINERGQIVGSYSDVPGGLSVSPRNFVLDDGIYTPIDPPGASFALVDDVNNRGEIVGLYVDGVGTAHGFLRDRRGRYSPIDHPDAAPLGGAAGGINDHGQIVGEYYDQVSTGARTSLLRQSSMPAPEEPQQLRTPDAGALLCGIRGHQLGGLTGGGARGGGLAGRVSALLKEIRGVRLGPRAGPRGYCPRW